MPYVVRPMRLEDVEQVSEAERECFTTPWPQQAYRRELRDNRLGRYIVLAWQDPADAGDRAEGGARAASTPEAERFASTPSEDDQSGDDILAGMRRAVAQLLRPFARTPVATGDHPDRIVGFAGMWLVLEEAHVTTICVRRCLRGHGFGELLLASLMEAAMELRAQRVTLEVRVSNMSAQQLYRKYTFREAGVRKRYYSDNGEDALIMWSDRLDTVEFRERFTELKDRLAQRLANYTDVPFSESGSDNVTRRRDGR